MRIRKERGLIKTFLSAYEKDDSQGAKLEWLEDHKDGQVEVLATNQGGRALAIEHTLIQPFVGEKEDTARFRKLIACLENDKSLVIPGRRITVSIPIGAVAEDYDCEG